MQLGFLNRTPRGRMATRRAYEHLGKKYPEFGRKKGSNDDGGQENIFSNI